MKNIIKTFLIVVLILFIIFVLGITTSNAELRVDSLTSAKKMIEEIMKTGGYLTGITDPIRDANPYLYCMQKYVWLNSAGKYELGSQASYPGNGTNNGHARAYALAAPGYIKSDTSYGPPTKSDERQWAWYYYEGDVTDPNALVNIANAYQNYKNSEKEIELVADLKAETIKSGNDMIYGPIRIKYSYASMSSGSKFDEWGGFNYAFFDEDGNNVSDRIQLCTKQNDGKYQIIKSTKISSKDKSNGYYKVATSDYSNVDIYILNTDDEIHNATIKIQGNIIDYTADVYSLEGEYYISKDGRNYCSECRHYMTNSWGEALGGSAIYNSGDKCYKYSHSEVKVSGYELSPTYQKLVLGGTEITTSIQSEEVEGSSIVYYRKSNGELTKNHDAAVNSFSSYFYNEETGTYMCNFCYKIVNNSQKYSHSNGHVGREYFKQYYQRYYYFSEFSGCGATIRGGKGSYKCGLPYGKGWHESQGLLLIDTAEEKKSIEHKLDFEIEFLTSVDVKKVWLDNNNAYNTRPPEILVQLYADGVAIRKPEPLNKDNNWSYTFEELDITDKNNKEIEYTVQEVTDVSEYGYEKLGIDEDPDKENYYIITNMLKTEVTVNKVWDDDFEGIENSENVDDLRPVSIEVKLFADGEYTGKSTILNEANDWTYTFTELYKCNLDGSVIKYTVQETPVPYDYEDIYSEPTEDSKGYVYLTITNSHEPEYSGYIEITGQVWHDVKQAKDDSINGKKDDNESGLGEINVILKDAKGNQFDATSTAVTNEDGTYLIKVNYDNSNKVYKLYEDEVKVNEKLKTAYIEFEYDGMKYTTVGTAQSGEDTSKAIEDEDRREDLDEAYSTVNSSADNWIKQEEIESNITAITKEVISFENYADKELIEDREEIVKYCDCPNNTYQHTNTEKAWGNILTQKDQSKIHTCDSKTVKVDVMWYKNVNLGLFEREMPDLKIKDDLYQVDVTMNEQCYTYIYDKLDKWEGEGNADLMAQFQNKKSYTYRRPVNPADIAEFDDEDSMYVTYKVTLTNEATSLNSIVHSIVNCYDTSYTLEQITKEDGTVLSYNSSGTSIYNRPAEEFTETTISGLDIEIGPLDEEIIFLRYKVANQTIKDLLNNKDDILGGAVEIEPYSTLGNAVEIESYTTKYGDATLYAEQRTGGERIGEEYPGYAGYDKDSIPGNAGFYASVEDYEYYEDGSDTPIKYKNQKVFKQTIDKDDDDIAPSLILIIGEQKTLSGTIWEDVATGESIEKKERLGNGKFDESEKTVQNVKVELFKKDGSPAVLYDAEGNQKDNDSYITYSGENGRYAFEGVVTGEYYIKYTYGNNTSGDSTEQPSQDNATTMDGGTTTVNARNYKSTIITDKIDGLINPIKAVLQGNYEDDSFDKAWHVNHTDDYSVAVDNMKDRTKIDDLYMQNYDKGISMSAYTKPFKTLVEFESTGKKEVVNADGDIEGVSHVLDKLDFGISERPREDLIVQKTITDLRLTLANGQELITGNPMKETLSYVKPMGLNGYDTITTGEQARGAGEKQLLVEIDSEIIQGAQLTLGYKVKVINNNEKDYDYGTSDDYDDIKDGNYITTNGKANYYYYGEYKDGYGADLPEMKATIEFVDYLDSDLVYNTGNSKWVVNSKDEIVNYNGVLIKSDIVNDGINNKYQMLEPAAKKVILTRSGYEELEMTATRLLSNKDEHVFNNHLEILKIDGKTARTIQESKQGEQIAKSYEPGNYNPSTAQKNEQDDDRVKVMITPPTGITEYITTYLVTGLVGMIIVAISIVFIKKKVLIK